MQYSFDMKSEQGQSGASSTSAEESLASQRLKKAIERNRAKQAARGGGSSTRPPNAPQGSSFGGHRNRFNNTIEVEKSGSFKKSKTDIGRRSVGRVDDLEFVSELKTSGKNLPAPVSYQTKTSENSLIRKRRTTSTNNKVVKVTKRERKSSRGTKSAWPIKIAWAVFGVLILRLIFAQGGVIEYYSQNDFYQGKELAVRELKSENQLIKEEILRIRTNNSYQKKLVRDSLGFIAEDEYLVMFSNRGLATSN